MTLRQNHRTDDQDHLLSLRSLVILMIAIGSGVAVRSAGGALDLAIGTVLAVTMALHTLIGR